MLSGKNNGIRKRWYLLATAVLIAVGLVYFPREYPRLGFFESLYFTLRLFVFEYDLPSFPTSWPLIFLHFAAPTIALSVVWSTVRKLFHLTPALRTRWLSNHVVVCGMGRGGKLIASTLRRNGVEVVGVDAGPEESFNEWRSESKVPMLFGNFQARTLLERAGALRARSIVFASGDDLTNLEGAVGAYDLLHRRNATAKIIWTHVANERLAETARGALKTEGAVQIRFFDTYHIAAARMVAQYFPPAKRAGVTLVTIIGFGKFGRDLLEVLVSSMRDGESFSIHVLDVRDRSGAVSRLAHELGVSERVHFVQADVHEVHLVDEQDKAFFLCTDDDLGNLTGAMMLASRVNATHIYVRMTTWPMSAIADHLGQDRGVTFVNINDLVVQGIRDLPGLFEPLPQQHEALITS